MNAMVSGIIKVLFIDMGTPNELSKPAYAGQQAGHVTFGSNDNPMAPADINAPRQPDRVRSWFMDFAIKGRGPRGLDNRLPDHVHCTIP